MAGLLDYVSGIIDQAGSNVKGLLSDPMQTASNIIDQLTQRAAAQQAATKAAWATGDPKIMAQNALDSSQTALGFAPLGITAWHGSPHTFDQFSLDKIGTGEGAQAYGHGLYLAENPSVANEYAAKLSAPEVLFGGKRTEDLQTSPHAKQLAEWIKSRVGAMQYGAQQEAARTDFSRLPVGIQKELGSVEVNDGGSLYKTDIPDEAVARFLDWDKPLSQQAPEVQNFIKSAQKGNFNSGDMPKERLIGWLTDFLDKDKAGSDLYALLGSAEKSHETSTAMRNAGIPGIRYLDGGSRGAGNGTSNFVAFDPEMIRILERNGQATGNSPWQPGEWRGLLGNN